MPSWESRADRALAAARWSCLFCEMWIWGAWRRVEDRGGPTLNDGNLERPRRDDFRDVYPCPPSASNIYEYSPEELVDKALRALQGAGIQPIEWLSLLHRRMNVPVIIKDYHYLVPDDQLNLAQKILEEGQGLPRSRPPPLLLKTGGDFYAKAIMYRVSRYTSVALAQHFVLYPASIASYTPDELEFEPRYTNTSETLCKTILVPKPPAVYASVLRMMRSYTRYAPTRIMLESQLSELIGYHLYGLEGGYVDTDDDDLCEELEVDERVEGAVRTVEEWRTSGQLRDEDGWIADTLADIVSGRRTVEDVPSLSQPS
ncbi:hypothetical protein PYCCODRAFT_1454694 [Trametes coccinea BRFM310]|uniref:Uncharacterized protein n=1 Tax=Trametes coccinea (strain BRFM310) TaxID=1353009 RepID=A0A1Y2IBM6_TRAC3|nr:hypothetical protein PYCCODRAFT_1454694 [Trametes coccinea BRFM310]